MLILLYLAGLVTAIYWVVKILAPEMAKPGAHKDSQSNTLDTRIEKLEPLLAEKNKIIHSLETESKLFKIQINNFSKVRTLLETEIYRLREQNRIFRSELGLPAVQSKESSIT